MQKIHATQWWVIKQMKQDSHHCGYMTYIWRVEECWSLSNVGYGPRTRQVILAHRPLLFTVILSFTVFSTTRGSFGVCECATLIDAATEFDSCYILQGEPWSIRWEPRQGYIKGIPVNLQHSKAQDPSLCSLFQTDAKVIVVWSPLFREKTRSYWLPVSPVAPHPPQSFNPISPPFRNALQSFFLFLPPSFLRTMVP